jgi:hypothetical protein
MKKRQKGRESKPYTMTVPVWLPYLKWVTMMMREK